MTEFGKNQIATWVARQVDSDGSSWFGVPDRMEQIADEKLRWQVVRDGAVIADGPVKQTYRNGWVDTEYIGGPCVLVPGDELRVVEVKDAAAQKP